MPLGPGEIIGTTLRLVRVLGHGGMGSVWIADHLTLHTQVAVKFMSQALMTQDDALTRFSREASAAAQVKSPHVVQMFDHGFTAERVPYIVMELLEGEDLGKRLARVGRLSLPETTEIVVQVCKALSKAHRFGIVHRDIKPENIFLIDSEGDLLVKVLDFGIAKTQTAGVAAVTGSGVTVGTPYYMSPEQVVSAKAVDHRSDLWSLGVVAYHCLTAARPFDGETLGALMISIDRGSFMAPSHLVPALGPAIDTWMGRALSRAPDQRFASAREMADALLASQQRRPVSTSSDGFPAAVPATSAAEMTRSAPLGAIPSASIAGTTVPAGLPTFRGGAFAAVVAGVVVTAAAIVAGVYALRPAAATSDAPAATMEPASAAPEPSSAPIEAASTVAAVEPPAAPSAAPSAAASIGSAAPVAATAAAKPASSAAAARRAPSSAVPKASAAPSQAPNQPRDHGF